jgi:pimeloyl-ACP methyl ester carboxylesterase
MLEVIDKGSASTTHPVPLLFVHGAWHAAWCWDEHFLGFFADRGYRAVALSFRGHGSSPTNKRLRDCSFADYVADVTSVAHGLPTPPVVIGHSMGGVIVQKYLESNEAPAGVLMASMPPQGYFRSGLRWLRKHPAGNKARTRRSGTPRTSGLRGLSTMKSYQSTAPPGLSQRHMAAARALAWRLRMTTNPRPCAPSLRACWAIC